MENQEEKTEVKEKKEWMRPETKTALGAIGLLFISIASAFLIAYSDTFVNYKSIVGGIAGGIVGGIVSGILGVIVGGILGGIVGGILGGIVGGIAGVIVSGILGGIWGGILGGIWGGIVGGILGGIAGGIWRKAKISPWTIVSFSIVLVLPFAITTVPLSKLHNYRQLERDQKIVEILQLRVLEDGVEVILPDKYVGENSYLKKVLSLGWIGEENKKRWKDIVVPCQEGKKYWFYARLPFPENKTETAYLELLLDHAYQDYTTTKEVSLK